MEEAARVLRIGRTKAYEMAREWRDTNGASGLPVIDLGSVLRVPREPLEALIGGPIHLPCVAEPPGLVVRADKPASPPASAALIVVAHADQTDSHANFHRATSPYPHPPGAQLDLFEPPAAS